MTDQPGRLPLGDSGVPPRIRSAEDQCRVQERLLTRGNSLGVVIAAALRIIRAGDSVDADHLARLEKQLRDWTADVRAVASEEAP